MTAEKGTEEEEEEEVKEEWRDMTQEAAKLFMDDFCRCLLAAQNLLGHVAIRIMAYTTSTPSYCLFRGLLFFL